MPTATQLLAQLSVLADRMVPLAFAWHVVLAVALLRDRRPRYLLVGLPASVAVCALLSHNPVNTISFAALSVVLARALQSPSQLPARGATRATAVALIALGWLYPHFLSGSPALYLIAAPVGVVPCPTLATVAGLALLRGAGRRTRVPLAAWCAAYAVIGVIWFHVWLDVALAFAAFALLAAERELTFPVRDGERQR